MQIGKVFVTVDCCMMDWGMRCVPLLQRLTVVYLDDNRLRECSMPCTGDCLPNCRSQVVEVRCCAYVPCVQVNNVRVAWRLM